MNKTPLYILLASVLMTVAFSGVAAQDAAVSVSGQCYDDDGSGGHDHLYADSDGDTEVLTVTGAVDAVTALTNDPEAASNGNGCSEDYGDDEDQDHLSATVEVMGNSQQVCYDSEPRTDGSCPTSPAGPAE